MSSNLKSGNAAVRFLLKHGEKLGMGAIAVCAGMLLWSAIGRERLPDDHTASNLTQIASSAQQKIDRASWDAVPEEIRIKADQVIGGERKPIESGNFPPWSHAIDRPILDPVGLRTDPVLFTAEELEVHGDSGLWASADPKIIDRKRIEAIKEQKRLAKEEERRAERSRRSEGDRRGGGRENLFGGRGRGEETGRGGSPRRGRGGTIVQQTKTGAQLRGFEEITARSWVTLLAKVPIEVQHQQYLDALQAARGYDPVRDVPVYRGYIVERTEVTDAGNEEWEQVARVSEKVLNKELQTYPVNVPDPIDPRYNHPLLTHPLPPLILREWGKLASHSSMPLASEVDPSESEEVEDVETAEADDDDGFFGGRSTNEGEFPGAGGEYGGRSQQFGGEFGGRGGLGGGEFGGGEYGGGEYGGGEYGGGEYGGQMSMGLGSRSQLGVFTWDHKTSHLLFRYFDNTVVPGHRYRYRVKFAISDVNDKINEKYLDKTVSERRAKVEKKKRGFRMTDWSEPSPIASVPLPARVYLVGVKPAKAGNFSSEPEAELLIKALNSEYAAELAYGEKFVRGNVVNLHEKAAVVWSNDYQVEKDPEFEFRTGITLIDFTGGQGLRSKNKALTAPARALLMDPAGRLFLQVELDDQETVTDYQAILEGGSGDRGGRGGSGGEYGGGLGGEFEGEF